MMPKVSVIVPVYNVREFLADCVASVRAQTLDDFECVLVDDGSTDGSGALCDALASEDPRFRVVHQPNGGLSAARNAGIEAARGELLAFVDSDDALLPDALRVLSARLERDGLDVAVGKVRLHDLQTGEDRIYAPLSTPDGCPLLDALFNVAAWNKLYRREVFATRRFPKGLKFEDMPVWADVLLSGAKVGFVDEVVYRYNVNRAGSIVTVRDYRGYPAAWTSMREALKARGKWTPQAASDFAARVALKFVQAFVLSSPATRRDFYEASRRFFRECGAFGLSRERGCAVAFAAWLQAKACAALPFAVYRVLFAPQALLASPRLNALLRRRLQSR